MPSEASFLFKELASRIASRSQFLRIEPAGPVTVNRILLLFLILIVSPCARGEGPWCGQAVRTNDAVGFTQAVLPTDAFETVISDHGEALMLC